MSHQDARRSDQEPRGHETPQEPVSDRQSLLNQLRDANEQLVVSSMRNQDLADQADASRAEAVTANRLKDEFLAVVSHELRTPLNAVLGWVHLLASGQLDQARTARAIQTIERNTKTLARIIDDLLDISRLVGGNFRIDSQPVDLIAVVQGAFDEIRPAAEAKSIRSAFTCREIPGPVVGDVLRLQQILANLLSNAVKFTPSGGNIEVSLSLRDSQAEIQVADTGQGIAAEFLPQLFERFTQENTSTTRRQGGIGLGLAIAKALVERHGGTIHADSPGVGQGATFTIRIPVRPAQADVQQLQIARTRTLQTVRLDSISVLLADDDADGRHVLSLILELAGANVKAVASVREALSALKNFRPDVLVIDIGMPDQDGYALIHQVRARGVDRGGSTPAIAVTGFVTPEHRARLLAAGFQVYLGKPVEPSEILAAVASLAAGGGK